MRNLSLWVSINDSHIFFLLQSVWIAKPMSVMQSVLNGFLNAFNCATISCLRQIEASKLMSVGNVKGFERAASNVSGFTTVEWSPVVDGVELTDFPINLVRRKRARGSVC